jgi:RNA polymerase sigma-70 factor (ECF subfamily)
MHPAEMSELARLVDQARGGDRRALSELVDLYGTKMYRFCYHHLQSRQAAEDAAQKTFEKVIRKLADLRDTSRFEPWLYQIAMNHCRDTWGDENKTREWPEGLDPRDPTISPQQDLEEREQLKRVRDAVAALPDHQREAFVLIHYERKSYQEAAEILGIVVETVKTRVFRATQQLRQQLQDKR